MHTPDPGNPMPIEALLLLVKIMLGLAAVTGLFALASMLFS